MGDQTRCGRLAVHSGDANDGDATVVLAGEHHLDDRFTDRSRLTGGWLDVHSQARSCVDFYDHSALALKWLRDVLGDDVDSCNIEADDACGFDCMPSNIRVDHVGNVACCPTCAQVGIAANQNFLAQGWNRIGCHPLFEQHAERYGIDFDFAQRS